MLGRKKDKPLYYTFPGQTKSNVLHNRRVLAWSCLFGVIVAGGMAALLYAIAT